MDIDLLSKMVKELILDNDKVVLPGFGAFVAEIVPSTFSDKGYTINPPYRKLYFRARAEEDIMLIKFYADSNKVDLAVADKVIRDFITELKSVLFARKAVVFPGLGRLRATKENAVFFVADEDMDIYPDGFALEPISLKTHVETPEQISSAVAQLKAIVDAPVVEPEVITEPEIVPEPEVAPEPVTGPVAEPELVTEPEPEVAVEPVAEPEPVVKPESEVVTEPVAEPEPEAVPDEEPEAPKQKASAGKVIIVIFIVLAALAVLFMAGFFAMAYGAPDYLDTLLYTPEELQILNYK